MPFDETTIPVAHRFNDPDCRLSIRRKKYITFLNSELSRYIWKSSISTHDHPSQMEINDPIYLATKKFKFEWDDYEKGRLFFKNLLSGSSYILIFWGPNCSCITTAKNFIVAWDDFFYISDENTVLITPDYSVLAYSFDEYFFIQ